MFTPFSGWILLHFITKHMFTSFSRQTMLHFIINGILGIKLLELQAQIRTYLDNNASILTQFFVTKHICLHLFPDRSCFMFITNTCLHLLQDRSSFMFITKTHMFTPFFGQILLHFINNGILNIILIYKHRLERIFVLVKTAPTE